MEELLLYPLLALEELDVVDEEDVVVPVATLEALDPRSRSRTASMKSFMNDSQVM